jgi:CRP/FNR family transcriptional regulator
MSEKVKSPDCQICTFRELLFRSLQQDDLYKLNACKEQFVFRRGEMICREGDPIESIIYVHRGLIKLHKRVSDTQSQIISIAKPFDFVGLLSVFSKTEFFYSITAIEDSSVCFITKECILNEIENNGKFALDILSRMSKITDDVLESKCALSSKNLRGRIAYILLDFANNIYKSNEFELPVSRREIAELIDMRTENVIRIMSEFRKDGLIKINGHIIEIINPEMLLKISDAG